MSELNLNNVKTAVFTKMNTENAVSTEINEEFSLPDYVPEIRRVLTYRASVLPESKFISDNEKGASLEFGGSVNYAIIYVDDEGNLCSTPLSSNYDERVNLNSHPNNVFIDTMVDNVSLRVVAPRKLTIKTRLKSKIYSCENKEYTENIKNKSSADELFIERQRKNINSLGVKNATLQNIGISEKFDTPPCKDVRPIWCDAGIIIKNSTPKNEYVEVGGDVYVKCICECDGEIITLTKLMPIYEDIECSGTDEKDMVCAKGRCVSLTISSEENENDTSLFFDVRCEIECDVYGNFENEVTLDCYSTKCEVDLTYKNIDVFSAICAQNRSFTVNETVKRKNNDISEIIDTSLDATCEKIENKNGRISILGNIKANIIGKGNQNETMEWEYLNETYDIPFRYDTDIPYANDMIARLNLNVPFSNVRLDEGKMTLNCEVYLAFSAISKSNDKVLDSATIKRENEYKKDNTCVRVFFPKKDDNIWEVAKKYHVKVSDIVEKNSLDEPSLSNVKHIII